jgi:chloramphenicol 3-O phosphotransferase
MSGMRRAVAAMAEQGNCLVVDDVMLGGGEAEDYRRLLSGFDVHFVGLFAPLDVLEQRERDRGDRVLGLARWQYERAHQGMAYDLEIDTTRLSPSEAAETIRQAFDL